VLPLVYSTGPVENAVDSFTRTMAATALNNGIDGNATVLWLAFALDSTKTLMDSVQITVSRLGSARASLNVGGARSFEIEAQVSGPCAEEVLLGVFGIDAGGSLNPAHRFVHADLTLLDDGIEAEEEAESSSDYGN
jgi:hypothetical protein